MLPACCWNPSVGFRGESSVELLSLLSAVFGERRRCWGSCSVWVQALWLLQRGRPCMVGAAGCLGLGACCSPKAHTSTHYSQSCEGFGCFSGLGGGLSRAGQENSALERALSEVCVWGEEAQLPSEAHGRQHREKACPQSQRPREWRSVEWAEGSAVDGIAVAFLTW